LLHEASDFSRPERFGKMARAGLVEKGFGLWAFPTGQILTHFKMDICERLAHRIHHFHDL
jgi:hypothetical protein